MPEFQVVETQTKTQKQSTTGNSTWFDKAKMRLPAAFRDMFKSKQNKIVVLYGMGTDSPRGLAIIIRLVGLVLLKRVVITQAEAQP